MKKLHYILILSILVACEKNLSIGLPQADPLVAFDAWLYHKAELQVIDIYTTNPYFESSTPVGIAGATVTVVNVDDPAEVYSFAEQETGKYVWTPSTPADTFATIGANYYLNIDINGTSYESFSQLGDVPSIDSITWRLSEETAFIEESFFANFWARDLDGVGNTYWIKSWKNNTLLNKPSEMNIAFDAAFSIDGNADGSFFIQPIRELINPYDFDEDTGILLNPFELGDSIFVEINSISEDAFYFLQQVQIQTDRSGGFQELFATPLANVQSNIFSENADEKVVGFFCVSGSSSMGKVFTEDDIRLTM